jgi:glycerol-3-phosphate acyltransferase PlsY
MPICNLQFAIVKFQFLLAVALIFVSYLCGSVPFGVLVARVKSLDIQKFGSGNIGATNVARALGPRWGFLVFGLDFLKGFGPTLAAELLSRRFGDDPFTRYDLPVLCALAAVLGHVFSIWLRFRGGKAGATGLGVGAVICWQAVLAAGLVWIVVVAVSRHVSLGTILGSIAYVAAYFVVVIVVEHASLLDRQHITRTVFCVAIVALVIARHKDNIRRLMDGSESKVKIW